jgi:hypothetical protein
MKIPLVRFSFALVNVPDHAFPGFSNLYENTLGFAKSKRGALTSYDQGQSVVLVDHKPETREGNSHLTGFGVQLPSHINSNDRDGFIRHLLDKLGNQWKRYELPG